MNVLGLCAGIGGLELGLHLAQPDTTPVCFVERDKFGQSILAARWPDATIHDDIFTLDTTTLPKIDIVTAGFPCQPWSSAGLRKGINDDRWILPEIVSIVRKVGPRYIFLENVAGLLVGGLGHVLGLLAEAGFNAEWGVFSCAGLGGSHRRERVFILAHPAGDYVGSDWSRIRGEPTGEGQQLANTNRDRRQRESVQSRSSVSAESADNLKTVAHPVRQGLEAGRPLRPQPPQPEPVLDRLPLWAPGPAADWSRIPATHWPAQFKVCSMADGVPRFLDEPNRVARLKALGNAVSPPVAAVAWRVLRDRIGR